MLPWDHQRTTAQHSTKQCHIASRSSALPAPGPYPFLSPRVPSACRRQEQSLRREGALPFKALPLQCQRKGAFKGHFWLGRPARPQIQNKNRSGAPDGWVSPAPQKGLIEPAGRAVGAHWAGHLASESVQPVVRTWAGRCDTVAGAPQPPLAKQSETHPQDDTLRKGSSEQTDPDTQQGLACHMGIATESGKLGGHRLGVLLSFGLSTGIARAGTCASPCWILRPAHTGVKNTAETWPSPASPQDRNG